MRRLKIWYVVLLVLWAVLIAPPCIIGFLYAGGDLSYHWGDWRALVIDVLFLLPLILLPLGIRKPNAR